MELEIRIPENWNDVTLEQYLKYYKSIKPYEGLEEFGSKIVENAIYHLCGVEANILNKLPIPVFQEISNSMTNLLNSAKSQELILSFSLGDTKYGFMTNIDQMSYGEYVDLVTYSKDVYENAALMCSILYRPILEEHNDKYTITEYKGTNEDQIELFYKKLTMDIVFGALSFFFAFTEILAELYPDLYNRDDQDDPKESNFDSSSNFGRKWGLYSTIAAIAGNDPTRFDAVTRLTVHECLTFLSYKRDLTILEANQHKMYLKK